MEPWKAFTGREIEAVHLVISQVFRKAGKFLDHLLS